MAEIKLDTIASVPAVNQYIRAANSYNVDYTPLLKEAGIDAAILTDNHKYVSGESMEVLLRLLVQASGDPCFGLHSSTFVEPSSYSVLGYIALNCSTPRAIQAKIPIYEKLVGDMGVTSVEFKDGYALQRWQCMFRDDTAKRHEIENVLGSWVNYARNFLNFDACEKVWFEHAAPYNKELISEYEKIFKCEVLFDQHASGLVLGEHLLDQALPQANDVMLDVLLEFATAQLADIDQCQSISSRVTNLLRLMIRHRSPTSETIARKLGMSSRSLQRRLEEEGTQYRQLLSELRLELALHYLRNTQLSLDSISYELGYTEARSFYRSFKAWTGRTAGSYRRASNT
jgi:AraC-like DNA-binding protein